MAPTQGTHGMYGLCFSNPSTVPPAVNRLGWSLASKGWGTPVEAEERKQGFSALPFNWTEKERWEVNNQEKLKLEPSYGGTRQET